MAARPRRIALTLIAVLALSGVLVAALLDTLRRPPSGRGFSGADSIPLALNELRVGVDPSSPPLAASNGSDYYGLEIDIAREIGARLNVPVRFVPLGFDGLYDALRVDNADIVIAALLPDESRMDDVMYTLSYFDSGLVLVSAAGSPFTSMDALPGHRLAYEFGSLADSETRFWLRRVLPFETMPYELSTYALDAVRLGQADAALVDAITARLYLRDHADWSAQVEYVTKAPYVIAARVDRGWVWAAVNEALNSMIHDGSLDRLVENWLGGAANPD